MSSKVPLSALKYLCVHVAIEQSSQMIALALKKRSSWDTGNLETERRGTGSLHLQGAVTSVLGVSVPSTPGLCSPY